jgi:hypothetical protein
MTIELVTLPVICLKCNREYRRIVAPPGVPADAFSSGYCPDHERDLLDQLYGTGRKVAG